jgi:hypothetical protein
VGGRQSDKFRVEFSLTARRMALAKTSVSSYRIGDNFLNRAELMPKILVGLRLQRIECSMGGVESCT